MIYIFIPFLKVKSLKFTRNINNRYGYIRSELQYFKYSKEEEQKVIAAGLKQSLDCSHKKNCKTFHILKFVKFQELFLNNLF